MAGSPVDLATGLTVVFGTSAFIMELSSIDWSGVERESIETTHLGTAAPGASKFGNRTFIPDDLSDPGELVLEGHFDTLQTDTVKAPPIDQAAETVTITWPKFAGDTTAAKWAASGFVTSYGVSGGLDEKLTQRVTVKLTGEVTVTVAA